MFPSTEYTIDQPHFHENIPLDQLYIANII